MAAYEPQLSQLALAHMPGGAELVTIDMPAAHAAVCAADLTGDRVPDIAAAYRWNGAQYLLVLQKRDGAWTPALNARAPGYGVTLMTAAPVTRAGRNNLIVGWQIGPARSKLSVYERTRDGWKDGAPPELGYSYIEMEDMPGLDGRDGKAEFALWLHDAGDAYRIDVMRWSGGTFAAAPDAYPYYYPRVVRYYEEKTRRQPDDPPGRYYLAEAQYRSGMPQAALATVRGALGLARPYPSRARLLELEGSILQMLELMSEPRQAALYPASLKEIGGLKWGFIDSSGTMKIPPRYDDAQDFQKNGLAIVGERGKYGLIDAEGRDVVRPVYDSINPFSERRAVVIDHIGFKLIDEKGKVLTKRAYPFIAGMEDGRAVFYTTSGGDSDGSGGEDGMIRYGYLDSGGNEAIPAQYMEAGDFKDGKAVVKIKDNDYALIAKDGRKLASYPYAYVGPLGDGLLAFQREAGGKYGYIDERGNVVIPATYTSAFVFRDGRGIVNTAEDYKSTYGVIDKQGRFVVQPEYNEIRDLGDKRLALGRAIDPEQPFVGSMFAIADWDGKRLTDFDYRDVSSYKDGLASASDAKQTYFIDRSGKPAAGYPRVDGSGTLTVEKGGLIKAFVDQRLSYLKRDGTVVWEQNKMIPLKPPYQVREEKYKPNPDYLVYYPQIEGMADEAAQRKVNDRLKELSQVKPIPGDQKLDYSYTGDFDVAFFKDTLLELELTGYNYPFGAAHGMPSRVFAIVNLSDGRMFELKDLFKPGSDYVKRLSEIVARQIKEDPQYSYVFPDADTGIKPDQPFYVTEDALHLYFEPYEIAPYVAGFPEFTIPFAEIADMIDKDGAFWKSFHA